MNRRDRRVARAAERAAERKIKREIPSRPTRACVEIAARGIDALWDRDGVEPMLAIATEMSNGQVFAQIGTIDEVLGPLEYVAPETARLARHGDRLRRLAAADAVIVAFPRVGRPAVLVMGRRGRFLAEEGLDDLAEVARDAVAIASGGDA